MENVNDTTTYEDLLQNQLSDTELNKDRLKLLDNKGIQKDPNYDYIFKNYTDIYRQYCITTEFITGTYNENTLDGMNIKELEQEIHRVKQLHEDYSTDPSLNVSEITVVNDDNEPRNLLCFYIEKLITDKNTLESNRLEFIRRRRETLLIKILAEYTESIQCQLINMVGYTKHDDLLLDNNLTFPYYIEQYILGQNSINDVAEGLSGDEIASNRSDRTDLPF